MPIIYNDNTLNFNSVVFRRKNSDGEIYSSTGAKQINVKKGENGASTCVWAQAYTLKFSTNNGVYIRRSQASYGGSGQISNGATIYYNDEINIFFSSSTVQYTTITISGYFEYKGTSYANGTLTLDDIYRWDDSYEDYFQTGFITVLGNVEITANRNLKERLYWSGSETYPISTDLFASSIQTFSWPKSLPTGVTPETMNLKISGSTYHAYKANATKTSSFTKLPLNQTDEFGNPYATQNITNPNNNKYFVVRCKNPSVYSETVWKAQFEAFTSATAGDPSITLTKVYVTY